jgi:hypothetical protein
MFVIAEAHSCTLDLIRSSSGPGCGHDAKGRTKAVTGLRDSDAKDNFHLKKRNDTLSDL